MNKIVIFKKKKKKLLLLFFYLSFALTLHGFWVFLRLFPLQIVFVRAWFNCDDVTSKRTDRIRCVVEDGSVFEWVKPDPLYLQ